MINDYCNELTRFHAPFFYNCNHLLTQRSTPTNEETRARHRFEIMEGCKLPKTVLIPVGNNEIAILML